MKRVINGLLYDTDISTLIYEDMDKRRRYFMTPNRHFFVVYRTGEFAIKSEDSIKELLGMHDYDKYVEIFNKPEEA